MNHPIHRRTLLGSGMGALGAVALESLAHAAEGPAADQASSPPDGECWAKPLAQDYTVVDRAGPSECFAGCQPDIVRLPDGTLLCQYPVCTLTNGRRSLAGMRLAVSRDDGATWQPQKHLDRLMGLMFVHRETLYQLGNPINRRGMFLRRSDDQGRTWSEPVQRFSGRFYNQGTGYVMGPRYLYRAFGVPDPAGGRWKGSVVVAGDLAADLMSPSSWRLSDEVQYPGTPPGMSRAQAAIQEDQMLEPNVIERDGHLFVLHRTKIDRYNVTGLCAICDLEDDGDQLQYRFGQFHPIPGAQHKFYVFYDPPSRLYWNVAMLTAHPPFLSLTGKQERRILMLLYSLDALNWFQAGAVAMRRNVGESIGFGAPTVVGGDLLVVSNGIPQADPDRRPSPLDGHFNGDTIMCHRVERFRSLALNIFPALDHNAT